MFLCFVYVVNERKKKWQVIPRSCLVLLPMFLLKYNDINKCLFNTQALGNERDTCVHLHKHTKPSKEENRTFCLHMVQFDIHFCHLFLRPKYLQKYISLHIVYIYILYTSIYCCYVNRKSFRLFVQVKQVLQQKLCIVLSAT